MAKQKKVEVDLWDLFVLTLAFTCLGAASIMSQIAYRPMSTDEALIQMFCTLTYSELMTDERAAGFIRELRSIDGEIPDYIFGSESLAKYITEQLNYVPGIGGCWMNSMGRWLLWGGAIVMALLALLLPIDHFGRSTKWSVFYKPQSQTKKTK